MAWTEEGHRGAVMSNFSYVFSKIE